MIIIFHHYFYLLFYLILHLNKSNVKCRKVQGDVLEWHSIIHIHLFIDQQQPQSQ